MRARFRIDVVGPGGQIMKHEQIMERRDDPTLPDQDVDSGQFAAAAGRVRL
jgi:hypothetical protein